MQRHLGANLKDVYVFDHGRNDGYDAMRGPAGLAEGVIQGSISGTTLTVAGISIGTWRSDRWCRATAWRRTPSSRHAQPERERMGHPRPALLPRRNQLSGGPDPRRQSQGKDRFSNHYEDDDFLWAVPANQALADLLNRPISNYYKRLGVTKQTFSSSGY